MLWDIEYFKSCDIRLKFSFQEARFYTFRPSQKTYKWEFIMTDSSRHAHILRSSVACCTTWQLTNLAHHIVQSVPYMQATVTPLEISSKINQTIPHFPTILSQNLSEVIIYLVTLKMDRNHNDAEYSAYAPDQERRTGSGGGFYAGFTGTRASSRTIWNILIALVTSLPGRKSAPPVQPVVTRVRAILVS